MTNTRLLLLVLAVLAIGFAVRAPLPRYEWRIEGGSVLRIDRWSGTARLGDFDATGRWIPLAPPPRTRGQFTVDDIAPAK